MNLKLSRNAFEADGVFGVLTSLDGSCIVAVTLEHAFPSVAEPITYSPIIPPGEYRCVRGPHQLAHMIRPFETFEITGVAGHSKVLLHAGNTNRDSEGCVLLGSKRVGSMITFSEVAFERFMKLQAGVDVFTLTVE